MRKTKAQLLDELDAAKKRIAELEEAVRAVDPWRDDHDPIVYDESDGIPVHDGPTSYTIARHHRDLGGDGQTGSCPLCEAKQKIIDRAIGDNAQLCSMLAEQRDECEAKNRITQANLDELEAGLAYLADCVSQGETPTECLSDEGHPHLRTLAKNVERLRGIVKMFCSARSVDSHGSWQWNEARLHLAHEAAEAAKED